MVAESFCIRAECRAFVKCGRNKVIWAASDAGTEGETLRLSQRNFVQYYRATASMGMEVAGLLAPTQLHRERIRMASGEGAPDGSGHLVGVWYGTYHREGRGLSKGAKKWIGQANEEVEGRAATGVTLDKEEKGEQGLGVWAELVEDAPKSCWQ